MADINFPKKNTSRPATLPHVGKRQLGITASSHANPLFLREEELRRGIELLFFAYRDFTKEPDAILEELGLGRAHHRIIYFVGRYPEMPVSDLLEILQITKQSLSRVLKHLIRENYIQQTQGQRDRRQRLLRLTDKGAKLEHRLTATQKKLIAASFRDAGAESVDGFIKVMMGMLAKTGDKARLKSPQIR